MELMQFEREREREREKERESGRHMALGVSAQLFQGAVAAIYLDIACSALASELSPLGLSGALRMNSDIRICYDFVVTRAAYARTFMRDFGRKKWRRKRGEGVMEVGAGPGLHA